MVMVAAHAIPSGTVLALQDIHPRPAAGTVPDGAYQSSDTMIGRVTARRFAPGDLLLAHDLRDAASLGIAARLAKGQRAFSIRVAEDEIVGGFLQTGDHVDILAVIPGSVFPAKTAGDVPDRSKSVLLLQNVLVLAVGENLAGTSGAQTSARTISLALEPDQASRLALVQRFGKVSLTIRHPGDETLTDTAPVSLDDIVANPVASPPRQRSKTHAPVGIPFFAGTRVTSAGWSRP
jgi:pilus assembly protein CpaB